MKLKKIIFGFICASMFVGSVNANSLYIKLTDDNNSKYKISVDSSGSVKLDAPAGANYYLFLSNNDTYPDYSETMVEYDNIGCSVINGDGNRVTADFQLANESGLINNSTEWNYLEGYEYAYVIKLYKKNGKSYCEMNTTPINAKKQKIEKGKRYNIYINGITSSYPSINSISNYYGSASQIKDYNKKIGISKIENDDPLLNKFLTGELNMTNVENKYVFVFGKVWELGYDNSKLINDFEFEEGAYYLIKTFFDNDSLRAELEDMVLVRAKNGVISPDNVEYLYEPEEPTSTTTTTKPTTTKQADDEKTTTKTTDKVENPKTGIKDYIVPGLLILFIGTMIIIQIGRNKIFKQIN